MTRVDITAGCDGANDIWQTAVLVASASGEKVPQNIVCSSLMKAPAGSPVVKVVDAEGKVLIDGTGSGVFYSMADTMKQVQGGGGEAPAPAPQKENDPAAAIRNAMQMFADFGDPEDKTAAAETEVKTSNGSGLSKDSWYTVSISAGGGTDIWQAAVQATSLRTRVQTLAGQGALPALVLKSGAAKGAVDLFAAGTDGEGLGACHCSGASTAEVESALG